MRIAVLKEQIQGERRVAMVPEVVSRYVQAGVEVCIEAGAGAAAHISDEALTTAGAQVAPDARAALEGADLIFKVRPPSEVEIALFTPGQHLVCLLDRDPERIEALRQRGVHAFALESVPRISRAQAMDVLSSQANLAGYKAVLDACVHFDRAMPMMMTAAGTVTPAKVFVMGVGVAGLQAIATARRLGAVVSASDVRPATKEQVESLGGTFVAVEDEEFQQAQTAGGYAKDMSEAYKARQAALIAEHIADQDIVITTALIPGRPAPQLVSEDMVASMRPGSVIVDLAVEAGGNCALSEEGRVVEHAGVSIVGWGNWPARIAESASKLYARNLYAFAALLLNTDTGTLHINHEDEIICATLVTAQTPDAHVDDPHTPEETTDA